METSRFPNKLKHYRRCSGYSQKKAARILGLSGTSMLSRWEHGLTIPGVIHLFRLSQVYRVLPHELYCDLWNTAGSVDHLLALDDEPFITNPSLFL